MPDVDLDALAPARRRIKLRGKWWNLPAELGLGVVAEVAAARRQVRDAQIAMNAELQEAERVTMAGSILTRELEEAQKAQDDSRVDELSVRVDESVDQLNKITDRFSALEAQAEEASRALADVAYELMGASREDLDMSARESQSVVAVAMGGDPTQNVEELLGGALDRLDPPAPAEAGKKQQKMAVPKTKPKRRAAASKKRSRAASSS